MTADLTRDAVLAMPAGPELDALVAERVLGTIECAGWRLQSAGIEGAVYLRTNTACGHAQCRPPGFVSRFSSNMGAAWAVVEHLTAQGWHPLLDLCAQEHDTGGPLPGVTLTHDDGRGEFICCDHQRAETMPLAICRAALLTTLPEERST